MPTKKKAEEAAPVLTEEHEAPADDILKEPVEAAADGSEHELVVETAQGGPVDLGTLHEVGEDTPELVTGTAPITVRALASFHDLETKRDYKAGDLVPWALERAAHYAARGLVVIEG